MNIYVGNLSYGINEQLLKEAFEVFGDVTKSTIIMDRETGRSRGFGFIEMPDDTEAKTAIESLNGTDLDGRKLVINEARPRNNQSRDNKRSGGYNNKRW